MPDQPMIDPFVLDSLKSQYRIIQRTLSTVDSARFKKRPMPEKWSMHDQVAHLARYQPVFIDRIHRMLHEDNPFFGRYKAEDDPEFEPVRAMGTDQLIHQIQKDREHMYELINGLDETQLQRTGTHKKFGTMTLMQWTEMFLLHEAHHIFVIYQLAHDTVL